MSHCSHHTFATTWHSLGWIVNYVDEPCSLIGWMTNDFHYFWHNYVGIFFHVHINHQVQMGWHKPHPVYFFIAFVNVFCETFLKYFWNIFEKISKSFLKILHNILLRFMLKIGTKCYLIKIKSIYKSFHYLKTKITMFNECFCSLD